jgi:hypothetical protein
MFPVSYRDLALMGVGAHRAAGACPPQVGAVLGDLGCANANTGRSGAQMAHVVAKPIFNVSGFMKAELHQ